MSAPVEVRSINDIKHKFLRPALTSHFICNVAFPARVSPNNFGGLEEWNNYKSLQLNFNNELLDRLQLFCSEASLPGSSLLTHEINNDFTGVTERHAYRRSYDDRADFTFYVDNNYEIIKFFELWISYAANEKEYESELGGPNYRLGVESKTYNYRVRFPDEYMTDQLTIIKFERDFEGPYLEYGFVNAFPISINSIPVSYESSQLLKCTVSFTYSRYNVKSITATDSSILLEQSLFGKIVGVSELKDGLYRVEYEKNGRIETTITNKKPPGQ
jgi:hypothetical protein